MAFYGTVFLLGLFQAAGLGAAELRVADMSLAPDAAWRRGAAEQEQADDAFLLEQPAAGGAALQVLVPRQATVLKGAERGAAQGQGPEQDFYRNLTRAWRAQYGKAAAIGWTEAGGRRWLTCRRPGRDAGVAVFHLATVYQDRAYSLLVFAPAALERLPQAAYGLAAGARFGVAPSRWVKTRTYRAQPAGAVMDALVQGDVERLAGAGMLTGYGLEYGAASLDWFLEGFRWQGSEARAGRLPFALRGRLEAEAPESLEHARAEAQALENPLTLRLDLTEGGGALAAQVRVHRLCGAEAALEAALAPLEQGERGGLEQLAREPAPACSAPPPPRLAGELRAAPGQPAHQAVALGILEMPEMPTEQAPPPADVARALLVEVALQPGPEGDRIGDRLGDALLRRAGLFFLYRPAR